jgi:beta-mannosidase
VALPDDLITSTLEVVATRASSLPPDAMGGARVATRVETITGHERIALETGWELATLAPYAAATASDLARSMASEAPPRFAPAVVPGTVAMTRRELASDQDALLLGAARENLDANDHVYRVRFDAPSGVSAVQGDRVLLWFGGLATLADVWLNEQRLFSSGSMFAPVGCDVTELLRDQGNELVVFFRALLPVLKQKQPRGRWPTPIVTEKHLRFVRTTLLGYTPGYCPSVRPVGPYGGVELRVQRSIAVERVRMDARLRRSGAAGDAPDGTLSVALSGSVLAAHAGGGQVQGASLGVEARSTLSSAQLVVEGHGQTVRAELSCTQAGASFSLSGALKIARVEPWWPHTHGTPALYEARVELSLGSAAEPIVIALGRVGFRSIERSAASRGDFGLIINGERVFCRGASWTPLDLRALRATPAAYAQALEQVRAAGMNMLRVPGTTTYESDAFHQLCDELGILVWQELMFANLDYPSEEPAFADLCRREASELLPRLCGRPSLAVLCGGSELEQQAAMMGMPPEVFRHPLMHDVLRELCARERPDVPYVSNSPSEGVLPFSIAEGPAHYYGVGAYLRPLTDARACRVKFASECLAFAQPPASATLTAWLGDAWLGDARGAFASRYRQGVPRDAGASWDFGDVTEHYVHALFGSDARALMQDDPERYVVQSRAACVEIMQRTIGILRARESGCRGLLVWFLRDLHLGAGWGVIDQLGAPKAAYYALKRAFAPVAAWLVDEGLEGIALHIANDGARVLRGEVEVALHRADGARVAHGKLAVEVPPRGAEALRVDAVIGSFVDSSYAYKFGPAAHTLVAARFSYRDAQGREQVCADCILPEGSSAFRSPHAEPGLRAEARALEGSGALELTLEAERFAPFVCVEADGFELSDDCFHLAPRQPARVVLTPQPGREQAPRARIRALGAAHALEVDLSAS